LFCIDCLSSLYIPHGSDESRSKEDRRNCHRDLYIPHGSDESLSHAQAVLEAYTFISHMVQMKETFPAFQKKPFTLYIPHGSDERIKEVSNDLSYPLLYIPHGSDERMRLDETAI